MHTDKNCIFCKIINKQIPAKIAHEDGDFIAIHDVSPQAPIHILILPKEHIENITEFEDGNLLGRLFLAAGKIAKQENIKDGFRLVVNTGNHGGQTVPHTHIHLLGGRLMTWPPG